MKLSFAFLLLTFLFSSCCTGNQVIKNQKDKAENEIVFNGFERSASVLDYFDRESIIVLETKGDTILLPSLIRVIENKGIYYALDRRRYSVIGFDKSGTIVCIVNAMGHSNLEYQSINDIAWDNDKDCLVLLADNKILFADKKGKIFDGFSLSTYYDGLAILKDNLYLANSTYVNMHHSEFAVTIMTDAGKNDKQIIPTLPEYAPFCRINGPTISTINKEVYFSRYFDPSIYSLKADGSYLKKYHINFGELEFIPKENTEYDCKNLNQECWKSNKFYAISDMQEGDELISGLTNLTGIFLIDKSNKTSNLFTFMYDFKGKVPLPNYIPVGNSDGLVFFYMPPEEFENFANFSKDDELIELASEIKSNTNPIFISYRLH